MEEAKNTLKLEDLINKLKEYNPDAIPMVEEAYKLADELHAGQFRKSREPYIIHPLNVAYILAELHADQDTICAGLLHDTLEDTKATKGLLVSEFNEDVANLVDGVTKISNIELLDKNSQKNANTRKIVTSIMDDVRIVIVKLADRLHNMRTLQYKSEAKQKEKSLETFKIFVPLALNIGAYRIRNELEDICFSYLNPDEYKRISEKRLQIEKDSEDCLNEMINVIGKEIETVIRRVRRLNDNEKVNYEIKKRIKNVYGIYRKLLLGYDIERLHDLLILKIMVDTKDDCYLALDAVQSKYNPDNKNMKDYLSNPKTNMYSSFHTSVYGPQGKLVQAQIRTFTDDKVASFGITTYWDIYKGHARYDMQEALKSKFQFFDVIKKMDLIYPDNNDFVSHVEDELFGNNIYVRTDGGIVIELPEGSTPVDFAYKVNDHLGDTIIGAKVDDKEVDILSKLETGNKVDILSDTSSKPKASWLPYLKTSYARSKVLEAVEEEKKYVLK